MTDYYTGNPDNRREGRWQDLPKMNPDQEIDPAGYLPSKALIAAVNVALELGMPLLLTGEPGCGKSRLAYSVAYELGFPGGEPLCFTVKSDTQAQDLFYRFDTLGRFHAANVREQDLDPRRFIRYNALGEAILRAKGHSAIAGPLMLPEQKQAYPEPGQRSVVLIDEIDKAPREVPNDILTEIENLSFTVPELFHGETVELSGTEQDNRPVVILTSNSERELPVAFLRRCIYFHVELPPFRTEAGDEVSIEAIVERRLGERFEKHPPLLTDALSLFRFLRESDHLQKAPSLAELLDWLRYLSRRLPATDRRLVQHPGFEASISALLKNHEDRDKARKYLIPEWRERGKT